MEDNQLEKIKIYHEHLCDGRDDLLQNTDKLIATISIKIGALLNTPASPLEKSTVITYLTKALAFLTELNYSVLKFVETEPLPDIFDNTQTSPELQQHGQSSSSQDIICNFKESLRESPSMFDLALNGLKIPKNQVLNQSKALDNTTLKAICVVSNSESVQNREDLCGEGESRSVSAVDLNEIKKNLRYLGEKMGYEVPVTEVQKEGESKNNDKKIEPTPDISAREVPNFEIINVTEDIALSKPNNDFKPPDSTALVLNNQTVDARPSTSMGAMEKQEIVENLIELSSVTSESKSCDKVSNWLRNTTLSEETWYPTKLNAVLDEPRTQQNTAIEKLYDSKRHDRHEEAREEARRDMPDLRFVPVKVPSVIKNDLNCCSSSTERNGEKKKKVEDSNQTCGVYDLKKMDPPTVGAICVFSHIVSPDEFYLQVVNDESTALMDEIPEKLGRKLGKSSSTYKTKQEAVDRLGRFCAGYILGDWHRLEVLEWQSGSLSPDVTVKSVDYGFVCKTTYKNLRELPTDLINIPELSIQCHFPMVEPPDSSYPKHVTEWPEMTLEALFDITNVQSKSDYSDIKMFQLIFAILEGQSLAVDMVPYSEPEADSLLNMLLDFGLAKEIVEDFGEYPEVGEFLEDVDDLERPETVGELVLGYDAKDEARICRFTGPDGTCFKGKNCKLEHTALTDGGYTTDKALVFHTTINDYVFPFKGETVQILVTGYIDSCIYFVQVIRNPYTKENTNKIMDRDLSDLMDAMNHPKKIAKYDYFRVYPAVGEVILAYAPSKMWLRVVVRELKYDNHGELMSVEVYAVDFGDVFTVRRQDIRIMVEDFMRMPFQALKIYLDKYQHKIGCDAKKARRFFQKHISYQNFVAHIESNAGPFKASVTTFKGREIGPTLVKEGFAEKRTMDISMAEGYKLDIE